MSDLTLVWLRRDLRLADNPILAEAAARGSVLPVYIHAPDEEAPWAPGGAQRVWLDASLRVLQANLAEAGLPLVIRQGPSLDALRTLIGETGASTVAWNRLYEPAVIERDRQIKQALRDDGLTVNSHNAALLVEPWEVATKAGDPYRVYTPFWRALSSKRMHPPVAVPDRLAGPDRVPASLTIDDLALRPAIGWDAGIRAAWTPGEAGAQTALQDFLDACVDSYKQDRDWPARPGTSRLSPHLHFGEIGPRQVWQGVHEWLAGSARVGAGTFLSEIGWREFAHHLLFHFPDTPTKPLDRRFEAFPWANDDRALKAWQQGQTGIPMVDAGMRELWQTGWMHNRVRMVVASFLTKNLRQPWQAGAEWFWDTLVDADLASNTLGWQWTAGCGADAAPFFRIFNPTRQGERFDPEGDYIRQWVPELARLPAKHVHAPWAAPAAVYRDTGVNLGTDYPAPLVDLKESRREALAAFDAIKAQR